MITAELKHKHPEFKEKRIVWDIENIEITEHHYIFTIKDGIKLQYGKKIWDMEIKEEY